MTTGADVLRKIITAHAGTGPAGGCGIEVAFDLAVGQATRTLFEAEGAALEIGAEIVDRPTLLARAPDPALLMPLDMVGGRIGILWFDPVLVNAVIEMVTDSPDNLVFADIRVPTLIDATLCRGFAANLLERLEAVLEESAGYPVLPRMPVSRHETEMARLEYTLEDQPHRLVTARVEFKDGVRGGDMALAIPSDLWTLRDPQGSGNAFSQQLAQNVGQAPMRLRGELQLVSMPVLRAIRLKPGDIIEISRASLSDVRLLTAEGVCLFHGRVGQKDGVKAISLTRGGRGIDLPRTTAETGEAGLNEEVLNEPGLNESGDILQCEPPPELPPGLPERAGDGVPGIVGSV